jgi:hypothetical protein
MSVLLNLELLNKELNNTPLKFFVMVSTDGLSRVIVAENKEQAQRGLDMRYVHCIVEIPPMKVVAM